MQSPPVVPVPPHLLRAIRAGEVEIFYGSGEWKRAARDARTSQHDECQRCKAKGFYAPCEAVHHKRHLRAAPELALTPSNLECLCAACHYAEHHPDGEPLMPERW